MKIALPLTTTQTTWDPRRCDKQHRRLSRDAGEVKIAVVANVPHQQADAQLHAAAPRLPLSAGEVKTAVVANAP